MNHPPSVSRRKGPENEHVPPPSGTCIVASVNTANGDTGLGSISTNASGSSNGPNRRQGYAGKRFRTVQPDPSISLSLPPLLPPSSSTPSFLSSSAATIGHKPIPPLSIAAMTAKSKASVNISTATTTRGEDTQPNESVHVNRARVAPLVAEVMTPRSTGYPIRPPPPFQSRTQPPSQVRAQSRHRSQPYSYPHVPIPVPIRPPLYSVNGSSGRGFNGQGIPLGPKSHRSNGSYHRTQASASAAGVAGVSGGGYGTESDRAGSQKDSNGTGNGSGRTRGGTFTRSSNQRSQSSKDDGNRKPAVSASLLAAPTMTAAAPVPATDEENQAALDAQEELAVRNSLILGEDEEDEERSSSKPELESESKSKSLLPKPTPPENRTMTRSVSRSLAAAPVGTSPTIPSGSGSISSQHDTREETSSKPGANKSESTTSDAFGPKLLFQSPPTSAQTQKPRSFEEDGNRGLETGSSRSKTEKVKFKPNTEFRRDTIPHRSLGEHTESKSDNNPIDRLGALGDKANAVDTRKEGNRASPRLTARNSANRQPSICPLKPLFPTDSCSSPLSKKPSAPLSNQPVKAKRPRNRQKPNSMLDTTKKSALSDSATQREEISVDDKIPIDLITMESCPVSAIETSDILPPPASNDASISSECQSTTPSETGPASALATKKPARTRKSSVVAHILHESHQMNSPATDSCGLPPLQPEQNQLPNSQSAQEKTSSATLHVDNNITDSSASIPTSDSTISDPISSFSQPLLAHHSQQINHLHRDSVSTSMDIPSLPTASPPLLSPIVPSMSIIKPPSGLTDSLLSQIPEDVKPDISLLVARPKSPTPPPVRPLKGSQPYLKDKLPPDLARALWSNERPEERARARKHFVETKRMELANTDKVVTSKGTWRDDGLALDWKLNTLEGKFTVLLSTEPVSRSELEKKHKEILSGKGKDVKAVDWTKDKVVFSWWAKQTEEDEEEGANEQTPGVDSSSTFLQLPCQATGSDVKQQSADSQVIPTAEPSQLAPTAISTTPIQVPVAPKLSRKRRASIKEKLAQNVESSAVASKKNQPSLVQIRQVQPPSQPLSTDAHPVNPLDDPIRQTSSESTLDPPLSSSTPPTSLIFGETNMGGDSDVERLQEEQRELEQRLANCHEKIRQRTQSVAPSTGFYMESPIPWHLFNTLHSHLLPRQVIVRGLFPEGTTELTTYLAETGLKVQDCIVIDTKDLAMITFSNEDEAMWAVANLNGPQRNMPRMSFISAVEAFSQRTVRSPTEGLPRPLKKPKLEEHEPEINSHAILGTLPGMNSGLENQTRLPTGPPAIILSEKYDFGVGQRPKPDSVSWFAVQDSLLAYTSVKGKVGLYSTKARSCLDEAEIDDLKPEESVSDIVFSGNRVILSRNYHRNHKPTSNGPTICPQISFINLRSDITPRIQSCLTAPHAPKGITCLASIPESQSFGRSNFVSGGNDGIIQSWSICPEGVATATRLPAKYHQMEISALSYQTRNSLLFSGAADGTLCTFDLAQNRPGWFGIPKSPGLASISQIHLNQDPNLFCIEYNNSDPFQMYDFRTRPQTVISLRNPNEMISIAHSRGQFTGNLFLKGTRNGQLKVWDIRKPDKLATIQLYSTKTMVRQVFLADDHQLFDLAGNKIHARAFSLS